MSVQMPVLRFARLRLITLFGLTVFFAANGPTGATTGFSTLYDFQGGSDGGQPFGSLIFDGAGALYSHNFRVRHVFKLTPPAVAGGVWIESVPTRAIHTPA